MTINSGSTLNTRINRKMPYNRIATKRHPGKGLPGKLHTVSRISPGKLSSGKRILRPNPPSCDNSNDSGLGFDQHLETIFTPGNTVRPVPTVR